MSVAAFGIVDDVDASDVVGKFGMDVGIELNISKDGADVCKFGNDDADGKFEILCDDNGIDGKISKLFVICCPIEEFGKVADGCGSPDRGAVEVVVVVG